MKYLTKQSPEAALAEAYGQHLSTPNGCEQGCPRCDNEWKLDVGAECNRLLDAADWIEKNNIEIGSYRQKPYHFSTGETFVKDIHSLVTRVAAFEELEVKK